MRLCLVVAALMVGGVAAPARADKKLDEAVTKAEAQLAKGKEDEAVKILQKAAAQAPKDPEPPLVLAQVLVRLGRMDDAAASLAKASELSASASPAVRARVLTARSSMALRMGGAGEALALAQQAVQAEGGASSLSALARAQARLGLPAARETAEKAVKSGPSSAAAHVARGDALLAAHLGREAEGAYKRASEIEPRSTAALAGLACALAAQGKAGPALEAARAATQADPHSGEAQAALALAHLTQDPSDKASEAMAAVQQGAFLEPRNPLVQLTLSRVFESRGQLAEAARSYAQAGGLDPSWPAPPVAAVALLLRQGDAAAAAAGFEALSVEAKSSGEAQLLLGRLLLRKEDWNGAKAALDSAAAALPGLAEAQAALGTAAYNVGELKVAAEAYGRAAALEPDNVAYLSNHGLFLGYDGRPDEGLAVLLQVVARPDGQGDAGAFINLGWLYRNLRPPKVAESVAAYEKARKLDPKSAKAALGVPLAYRAAGQWARAISAYEHVSQAYPKLDGPALVGTAWCYLRSGEDYKARFYTHEAAKVGADVRSLREALLAPAKPASAALKSADELSELAQQLEENGAGEQAFAAQRLMARGRAGVPPLASALRDKDTALAVREQIVDGLARMGPAAGEALAELDRQVKAGPRAPAAPGLGEREAKLVVSMRAAASKIRGR
ncbi:MAG TPA: tetratricopeptide repeat protein [Vicinamibacteria bacterium]|nr:tetratricopeptide repeat protein [Vicinamibacteria bacterium]